MTFASLLLGACTMSAHGPDPAAAFATARLAQPEGAEELRVAGQQGLDAIVWIQLLLPSAAAAEAWLGPTGCALSPIVRKRDNPFVREGADDPSWWVHAAPEGARACNTQPSQADPVTRHARVDPLIDGRVRVQVAVTTS